MSRLADAWTRFWFDATPTSTLAVVRIVFGSVVTLWALSLAPDLFDLFSDRGILSSRPDRRYSIDPLSSVSSDALVVGLYVLLLVAAACLTLGYRSRLAAVVVFLGVLSFEHRNPLVFNSGDLLLLNFAFFLMLAPTGVSLSVDRWRRERDRFWDFPTRAPWALRLVQVQLSVVYLSSVWAKLRGTTWNDGTAIGYVLRLRDVNRFIWPPAVPRSLLLVNLMTYATLGLELALALLVWRRRARPWVLLLGLMMHLLIELSVLVGFFSIVLFVGYLAFTPANTMSTAIIAVRRRLSRSRVGALRRWAAAGPPLIPPAEAAPTGVGAHGPPASGELAFRDRST